ncbi:MAG: Ca-activated chloride channel family protein [Saprospiraceae bacterium]|jgi:Ca-activated chloride channel family protein
MNRLLSLLFVFLFAFVGLSNAQVDSAKIPETTRILFIFDASQSMFGHFSGESKIDVAQKLFSEALDSLKDIENLELALRVYGNRSNINSRSQDCEDTHLEVPFGNDNIEEIKHVIKAVVPKGTTPIARSLELSKDDFLPCSNCRNVIVLITDGIEACDGDPCAIARALRKNDVFLKPFVIGVGVIDDYKKHFYCIGNYYDAKDKEQFKTVLSLVLSEALNNTTCQVNLLDVNGRALETNVNMTFYDQHTGEIKYNYIHTMNIVGLPDTLGIDPSLRYRIKVHTIPSVTVENVIIKPAQHNIIPIETPQGSLLIKTPGRKNIAYEAVIKVKGDCNTLNHQKSGVGIRYLVGTYDVEVLSLPRLIKQLEVSQGEEVVFEVPVAGKVFFNIMTGGYGSVYVKSKESLELIYNLNVDQPSEMLDLLPGNYLVVYRSKHSDRSFQTVEKEFTIKSGKSVRISL